MVCAEVAQKGDLLGGMKDKKKAVSMVALLAVLMVSTKAVVKVAESAARMEHGLVSKAVGEKAVVKVGW